MPEFEMRTLPRGTIGAKRRRFQQRVRLGGGRVTYPGWPDWTNTGPQVGTQFTTFNGLLDTTAPGQVIQNLVINGAILVHHSNVTVRNCVINAGANFFAITDNNEAKTGVLIERCRIVGGPNAGISLTATNPEVRFCDISGCENGISPGGSGWNIHDNFIHDLAGNPGVAHVDGIQFSADLAQQYTMTVRHNNIISWDTSCTILGNGNWNSIVVDNNRYATDPMHRNPVDKSLAYGCLLGIGSGPIGVVTNVSVTNNVIDTKNIIYPIYFQKCTAPFSATGNTDLLTGAPISPTIET